jgi:hypothetical protein
MLFCTVVHAQQRILNGYLKDASTHLPIAGGILANSTTNEKMQTDAKGFFRFLVSPGDLLYTIAANYYNDTIRYSLLFQDTITILLAPTIMLGNVTVQTGYQKYQADSLDRRREFEQARGQTLSTIDRSSYKPYFGLTVNLDRLFKTKFRNKKRDEQSFQRMEEYAYINYRFAPQLVSSYTGLKGNELLEYMRLYTPTYEWLRKHLLKEQLLNYLNERMAHYRSDRLQK